MRRLDDMDFTATREVVAASDRERDVYEIIDDLRQDMHDSKQNIRVMRNYVRALEAKLAEIRGWTDTGILNLIESEKAKQHMKLEGKVLWLALTGAGTLLLAFLTWITGHLVWK